jgi:hypothetical protein
MGCRILSSPAACLYDSVTDWCFGPIFDTEEDAEDFLEFLRTSGISKDPRIMSDQELSTHYSIFYRNKNER